MIAIESAARSLSKQLRVRPQIIRNRVTVFIQIFLHFVLAIPFLFCVNSSAVGADWAKVQKAAEQRVIQAQQDAAQTSIHINEHRKPLLEEIAKLEASVKQEEARLEELVRQFEAGAQREREMQAQLQQEQADAERVTEVFLEAQKEAGALFKSSLFAAAQPTALPEREGTGSLRSGPDFADVRRLAEMLFAQMEKSGKIELMEGAFIGPQGTEVKGDVLLLGNFHGFYQRSGEVGFLRNDQSIGRLFAVPLASSWWDRNQQRVKDYFAGKGDILPIDLSKGEVIGGLNTRQDLLAWLRSGGFLVWPILLVGLVALLLIIERFVFLIRTKANSDRLLNRVREFTSADQWQECQRYCQEHAKSSVCRVLGAGIGNFSGSREVVENALQEAIMKELPRLERFLSTISVLAAVAPLLGLLGTVSGMINTFQAITVHGTGDPRMLSGGISEALITTQLGLMVAVPVLMLHHFLERRVDAIVGEMEEKSAALTLIMLKNGGPHAGVVRQVA